MADTSGAGPRDRIRDRDELKEIKVKIPISQHIKLHRVRLLTETTISQTVRDALEHYFALLREQADAGPEETGDETGSGG